MNTTQSIPAPAQLRNENTAAAGGRGALVLILAAGFVVRLVLWLASSELPIQIADARDYNGLAVRLVTDGAYQSESGELISLRPPLYPAVVAAIYRVFGIENLQAVRAAQAALSLLNTLIIYRLALVAYSRRTALWAAAGYCFYPSLLGFNQFLLSETLFTFFVSLITWVCAEALRRDSLRWLVVVGLLLGLGALTRSILWLFAPILSAYLFVAWRGRIRERLLAAVVPALLFGVTIAPWAWRNTRLHETPVLIDVMGGRNVMMGNYEHTPLERSWATISLVQGERAWHAVLLREHPQTTPLTQGQLDKLAMRHGIRFALQHPALTAQRTLVRFFNFWQLERTLVAGAQAGFFGDLSTVEKLGLAAVVCGSYAAAIFLGIFGAATAPPADRRLHALLLLTVLFPCAVHSLIFAHSRYHLPIMPIVLVYSAAAIVQFRSLGRPRGWRFDLALLLCVILVLGWLRELVFVDLANASQLVG